MKPAVFFPICWKKKFLTRTVDIELYDPFPKEGFERLLSCLPDGSGDSDGIYRILPGERCAYLLMDSNGYAYSCQSWFEAYYLMDSLIYDDLFPQDKNAFIFHSAAVCHRRSGQIIWLMGPSMSGKSSLSMALVHSGAFDYLSEEAIGLHPPSGETLPFPRALRMRRNCREILGSDALWEIVRDDHHDSVYVKPPPDVVVSEQMLPKPSVIFLLNYAMDVYCPFFSTASSAILLANLMTFCVNEITFLTAERIAFLTDYCRGIPAFSLQWRRIPETVAALEKKIVGREYADSGKNAW